MTCDAIFVGVATWDTVVELPHLPDPDGRAVASEISNAGGGPAATASVAFARLGGQPRLFASVGDDPEARSIRAELAGERVDVARIQTVAGASSGRCVVLIDRSRASRAICVKPGPPIRLGGAVAPLLDTGWVHTDHAGWPPVAELLAALPAGSNRPRVSYDAGNLHPARCPAGVDLYSPTMPVLRSRYGQRPAHELLALARAEGPAIVVATDGGHGAYAADAEGAYHVPAHRQVEVRSSLGAGDVFHGALLAALVRGQSLPAALAFGNAAAALSCRGLDGRAGIPGEAETSDLAAHQPARPLQPSHT